MMGSSAGSSPATLIKPNHAGAPPSSKICLKNAGTRPAAPSAAPFSQPATNDWAFEAQKRGAAPSAAQGGWRCKAKTISQPPRWVLRRVGTEPRVFWVHSVPGGGFPTPRDAGMQPASGRRVSQGWGNQLARGTGFHHSFLGAGCVLHSNNHKSVLAGEARCFRRVEKPWQRVTRSLCVAVRSRCRVSAIPGVGGERERGQGEPVGTHPAEPRQSSAVCRNLSSPGVANERLAQCKGSPPAHAGPCVNEVPAGPRVPFPGTNNPGESKKQSWQVSWLQDHPSLDFHYFQLPFKNEKPEEGRVPWESSLGPRVSGGFCSTKINLCCGSLVPWRPPPAGNGGTFVYRLRILHAPLAPFLIRVG